MVPFPGEKVLGIHIYVSTWENTPPSFVPSQILFSPAENLIIQQPFVKNMLYEKDCITGLKETQNKSYAFLGFTELNKKHELIYK